MLHVLRAFQSSSGNVWILFRCNSRFCVCPFGVNCSWRFRAFYFCVTLYSGLALCESMCINVCAYGCMRLGGCELTVEFYVCVCVCRYRGRDMFAWESLIRPCQYKTLMSNRRESRTQKILLSHILVSPGGRLSADVFMSSLLGGWGFGVYSVRLCVCVRGSAGRVRLPLEEVKHRSRKSTGGQSEEQRICY